jgi:hypothetical protein
MIRLNNLPLRAAGLILAALLTCWCGAQAPTTVSAAASAGLQRWRDRLQNLVPSQPLTYFELAEEIADAGTSPEEHRLAQQLFGLAGALDPKRLGRSACLALADLEENSTQKQRLLAMASLLGEARIPRRASSTPAAANAVDRASLAFCEALGRYRKGQGAQALASLHKPGVEPLLARYGELLPGGAARFEEQCKSLRPQNRPALGPEELARQLRLEAALLAGDDRSWSGELLLNGSEPLIEVDPDRLEELLSVDPSKPLYRNGRWTSP